MRFGGHSDATSVRKSALWKIGTGTKRMGKGFTHCRQAVCTLGLIAHVNTSASANGLQPMWTISPIEILLMQLRYPINHRGLPLYLTPCRWSNGVQMIARRVQDSYSCGILAGSRCFELVDGSRRACNCWFNAVLGWDVQYEGSQVLIPGHNSCRTKQ